MTFTEYLQQKKYTQKTIATYGFYITRFLSWLQSENLSPESFTYTDLLEYMRDCQEKGITNRTVNNMLGIIRHYCNYLNLKKKRSDNPAAGVFIKGLVRKLPSGLLNFEDLEELYKQYSIQLHVERSKKILFGLMVYQRTSVAELMRVTAQDIKLK